MLWRVALSCALLVLATSAQVCERQTAAALLENVSLSLSTDR